MSSKHTQEPWWWDETEGRVRSVSGRETGGKGITVARVVRGEMGPVEYTANGLLIAAAPTMLAILREIDEARWLDFVPSSPMASRVRIAVGSALGWKDGGLGTF